MSSISRTVLISTTAALHGAPGQTNHAAAKGASSASPAPSPRRWVPATSPATSSRRA
ncbi:hypothetical protein [Streptomyces sp. HM190]|uniref:hypothetical protein n=1 Tax=Streptomyces sp. HM190 TaxID=2695266 RepID=UPI001F3A6801|nr:hypothetical protein [Streptomyces sp. HM190]